MRRLHWIAQDLIDAALDRLGADHRWQIVDFLYRHGYNICITEAYFWAEAPLSGSFFDIKKQIRPKDCFWVGRDK
jgi:hypothetical protein